MLDAVRSEPSVASVAASWPGGLGGRAAAGSLPTARLARSTAKAAAPVDVVPVRLAGILQRPRHRSRARTRLRADRAERKRRGGGRVGKRRAPAVAGSRRGRAGPAARAGPERRSAGAGRPAASLAHRRRRRHRPGRGGLSARRREVAGAGVYLPIGAEAARTSLTMRVHGDPERARRALVERLTAIDPNMGEVTTLRTSRAWKRIFWRFRSG